MVVSPKFLDVAVGALVRAGSALYRVEAMTTADTVLARNLADGSYTTLHVPQLAPAETEEQSSQVTPDLVADAADYETAQRRLIAIEPLLKNPLRTRSDVGRVARSVGKSITTIYAWMRIYEDSPQVSSLIPAPRGPEKGSALLDARQEEIIGAAIARHHRVAQRKRVSTVILAVKDACRSAGLMPPHGNTVRNRIKALPRAATLRSQGRSDEARDTLEPMLGTFPDAISPLSVIQMDHGLANVEIVDERMRLALGRPWVTVAMDIYTRTIVGLVVSLEHPSSFAAGRCIANAMLPKDEYLRSVSVPGDWPAWGKPGIVHMDNAKEFRGELLKTAFAEYGIDLRLRKVKTPHYGGHIERLMRTFADAMRNLPGATFASPEERKGYNSSDRAAMTLAEFEAWLVDHIVNTYHQESHAGLNMQTPAAKWRDGITGTDETPGIGIPAPPAEPERVRLDFLPFVHRTVGRRGILLDYIHYWHDGLRNRIAEPDPDHPRSKRKFLVRVDPRDVTRVWFLDPDTRSYVLTPTLNVTRPAVSRWEWKAVQRQIKAEGIANVDEDRLFQTRERLLRHSEDAVAKTKTARRHQQRAADAQKYAAATTDKTIPRASQNRQPAQAAPPSIRPTARDLFDGDVMPFDDIDA